MEDAQKVAVGRRIRAARAKIQMSGVDFANAIGVRPHTLWRYEKGQYLPGTEALSAIARVAGVTMEWIVAGEGDGPPIDDVPDDPAIDIEIDDASATGTDG